MQANRGKDTSPELLLRRALREAGLSGYRLHWSQAPGRPDIAYPGRKVAIFVNGCFWHRCPHCDPPHPKANRQFWADKFAENCARDQRKSRELEESGWKVLTVWECRLKSNLVSVIAEVEQVVRRQTAGPPV
jgi:DNA mismatch endonuclease (patch repair protein)